LAVATKEAISADSAAASDVNRCRLCCFLLKTCSENGEQATNDRTEKSGENLIHAATTLRRTPQSSIASGVM
jgi:hypothetical protein